MNDLTISPISTSQILSTFFDATGGANWVNRTGWNQDGDVCAWYGVTCDSSNNVVSLELPSNQLSGTTPETLFMLPALEELTLNDNDSLDVSLNGMENAVALRTLNIAFTATSSLRSIRDVPDTFRELDVTATQIQSEDVTLLFGVGALETLSMGMNPNALDSISAAFFKGAASSLTNLQELRVPLSGLTGEIPISLGTFLTELTVLDLSQNSLQGTLPATLTDLDRLLILDLSSQNLTGTLPAFDTIPNLGLLNLSDNAFTGTIPATFFNGASTLGAPLSIDLSNNTLSGSVPQGLIQFPVLNLDVTGNQIISIPQIFCFQSLWWNEAVGELGCDALICPPNSYNVDGRQTTEDNPCLSCPGMPYYGATDCNPPFDIGDFETLSQPPSAAPIVVDTMSPTPSPTAMEVEDTPSPTTPAPIVVEVGDSISPTLAPNELDTGGDTTSPVSSVDSSSNAPTMDSSMVHTDEMSNYTDDDMMMGGNNYTNYTDDNNTLTVLAMLCPDGEVCLNGGVCVRYDWENYTNEGNFTELLLLYDDDTVYYNLTYYSNWSQADLNYTMNSTFLCDCENATVDGLPHAGIMCEAPATDLCNTMPPFTSFCTNNGICIDDEVGPGLEHAGCECPLGFEGPHCAFLNGTWPNTSSWMYISYDDDYVPAPRSLQPWQVSLIWVPIALMLVVATAGMAIFKKNSA